MAGSRSLWPGMGCPLYSRNTRTDLSTGLFSVIAHILQVRRERNRHSYSHNDTIAMDETAVWQDMLSSFAVDNVGEKLIRLKTTGHEKSKVSVFLTAKADGTKLKPFLPGAKRETKQLNEDLKNKCYVASSVNG